MCELPEIKIYLFLNDSTNFFINTPFKHINNFYIKHRYTLPLLLLPSPDDYY